MFIQETPLKNFYYPTDPGIRSWHQDRERRLQHKSADLRLDVAELWSVHAQGCKRIGRR